MRLALLLILVGQLNPPAPPQPPGPDAERERAIAWAGPRSREFVTTVDGAIPALRSCSRPCAQRLVEFHASGALNRLPRPPDLLRVIATYGDYAVVFAMWHMGELADPDCFDAFVMTPEDYICGARLLQQGAEQVRASKRSRFAIIGTWDVRTVAFWGGLAAIAGLVVWRRRRREV